jgi:hypothetical protein
MTDRRPLLYALGAALFYALIFMGYSHPIIRFFGTSLSGIDGGDSAQYIWNAFIFKHHLVRGESVFYTNYVFYPQGANLFFHTYTPLLSFFALPFDNLYLAINLMLGLQFVLSGVGAYLLSESLLRHRPMALLAGFVFAFSPYKMAHFEAHFHLMLTATVPFYVLTLLRAVPLPTAYRLPTVSSFAALGWAFFLLLLTFFSDYYATFYLLYFTGIYLLFPTLRAMNRRLSTPTRWLLLGGMLLVSHFTIAYQLAEDIEDKGAFWWQPDLTCLLVPSFMSYFFDTTAFYARYHAAGASSELPVFLGWSFLLLLAGTAVLFFKTRPRQPRPAYFSLFVVLTLFFLGLTLPKIQVLGRLWLYLPTGFHYLTYFLNNIRIPGRAVLMVYLFLPLVLGYGWVAARQALPRWAYRWVPVMGLGLLVVEFLPRAYAMQNREAQRPVNEWLGRQNGEVLLSFPLVVLDGFYKLGIAKTESLIDQITHQKKMLGGYVSRVKPETFRLYRRDRVCQVLFALQAKDDSLAVQTLPRRDTERFLRTFRPDVIHVPPEYRNRALHRFIQQNFAPYVTRTDSLRGHTVYRLRRLSPETGTVTP